eukprot:TRINITY_DN5099_c1_g1_i1.p1 TRINITY_DN5099_c1_g1~~TRINITY_DN5099_c1_g1_i1.p1  ORF type:complete len:700 (-),score=183.88 TRINITY_DN5099_c1_g1_i1:1876-3735(-)
MFVKILGWNDPSGNENEYRDIISQYARLIALVDEVLHKGRCTKIKTDGFVLLASTGVPYPCDDHAHRAMVSALQLFLAVDEFNKITGNNVELRIGLHSGPVVGGVIGRETLAFDLWGDTVNIAARMMQHGITGKVQVSPDTHAYIKDEFSFEQREPMKIKGKGLMTLYTTDIFGTKQEDQIQELSRDMVDVEQQMTGKSSSLLSEAATQMRRKSSTSTTPIASPRVQVKLQVPVGRKRKGRSKNIKPNRVSLDTSDGLLPPPDPSLLSGSDTEQRRDSDHFKTRRESMAVLGKMNEEWRQNVGRNTGAPQIPQTHRDGDFSFTVPYLHEYRATQRQSFTTAKLCTVAEVDSDEEGDTRQQDGHHQVVVDMLDIEQQREEQKEEQEEDQEEDQQEHSKEEHLDMVSDRASISSRRSSKQQIRRRSSIGHTAILMNELNKDEANNDLTVDTDISDASSVATTASFTIPQIDQGFRLRGRMSFSAPTIKTGKPHRSVSDIEAVMQSSILMQTAEEEMEHMYSLDFNLITLQFLDPIIEDKFREWRRHASTYQRKVALIVTMISIMFLHTDPNVWISMQKHYRYHRDDQCHLALICRRMSPPFPKLVFNNRIQKLQRDQIEIK